MSDLKRITQAKLIMMPAAIAAAAQAHVRTIAGEFAGANQLIAGEERVAVSSAQGFAAEAYIAATKGDGVVAEAKIAAADAKVAAAKADVVVAKAKVAAAQAQVAAAQADVVAAIAKVTAAETTVAAGEVGADSRRIHQSLLQLDLDACISSQRFVEWAVDALHCAQRQVDMSLGQLVRALSEHAQVRKGACVFRRRVCGCECWWVW